MNKRRLLKLAEFLETAELPGTFKMSTWIEKIDDGEPACGTAACAGGWAALIPSFRRAGYVWSRSERYGDRIGDKDRSVFLGGFFGLDWAQCGRIFWPGDAETLNGKRGRNTVAKRIRKLVEAA